MAGKTTDVNVLLERLREKALARGVSGIKTIGKTFRIMDDDGSKALSYEEFKKGLRDYGMDLTEDEMNLLCREFDTNKDGSINFDEFLIKLRPPLNPMRLKLIQQAFAKLDADGSGVVTIADLKKAYDCRKHPKYESGEWNEKQVFTNFLKSFDDPGNPDGEVTLEEFINYYAGVSASIDNDLHFDLMMRKAWKL